MIIYYSLYLQKHLNNLWATNANFCEEYPKIIKDIKLLVIEIRELITSFNPLQLLQCCYYKAGMILVHDINKEISSPVNFTNEENTILKMLSYTAT